jgi:lipopolysaccharide export system permease protein
MRILGRYVFRQTAGALLLILISLTAMTWIAVALRQLDLMTTQGQDAPRFLAMTTLAIPSMMALIAPIALLIAAIHVLNRLNSDSELIVMTAGGAPVWSLLKPLGLLALLVALGVAAVNHWVGPWAQQSLRELAVQVRSDLIAQVIQPWRFTSPEAKLTVHIRDRAPTGELLGLLMYDARDPKQTATYLAERGRIIKQDGAAYLRMDKGHILRRVDTDPTPQIIAFESYVVDLQQLEQRVDQTQALRPRERYTPELLWPDANDQVYKHSPGSLVSELHDRFASPLYAFAFVMLVLAFMGQAQTTRQNRIQAVIAGFAVAITCRILGIGAANMVVVRPALNALLYAVPIGAGLLAAIAVQWHLYPRPPSRLARSLMALVDRAGSVFAALLPRRPHPEVVRRMGS